jgi:hypothetical protein
MSNIATFGLIALLALPHGAALWAQNQSRPENREQNLESYVDLLRQDVKTQKVAILNQMLNLSPDQSAKFWPVYAEYDKELTSLVNQRIAAIKEYAANYGNLGDAKASELAHKALDLESRRNALKKKYFDRFAKVLSGKFAAKFLQIENQLLMIIDLQLAANLPVVE